MPVFNMLSLFLVLKVTVEYRFDCLYFSNMSTCVNKDNHIYYVYVKITYVFCASLMGELKKMSGLYFIRYFYLFFLVYMYNNMNTYQWKNIIQTFFLIHPLDSHKTRRLFLHIHSIYDCPCIAVSYDYSLQTYLYTNIWRVYTQLFQKLGPCHY
jgi:hypothetical protein